MSRAPARERRTGPEAAAPRAAAGRTRSAVESVLELQATAGNSAVARLLRQAAAGTDAPPRHRLLRPGDEGSDVYLAKIKLNAAGADPPLAMSVSFDAPTADAVRRFQTDRKLQVDGEIGQQTWAALDQITAGRTPGDEAEFDDITARTTYANELFEAGELKKAGHHYDELYADPRVTPDIRNLITFHRAHIAQANGDYDNAISLYSEYLQLPHIDTARRRNALQRIREARNHQPPGPLETDLNQQAIDPNTLPAPGA